MDRYIKQHIRHTWKKGLDEEIVQLQPQEGHENMKDAESKVAKLEVKGG